MGQHDDLVRPSRLVIYLYTDARLVGSCLGIPSQRTSESNCKAIFPLEHHTFNADPNHCHLRRWIQNVNEIEKQNIYR